MRAFSRGRGDAFVRWDRSRADSTRAAPPIERHTRHLDRSRRPETRAGRSGARTASSEPSISVEADSDATTTVASRRRRARADFRTRPSLLHLSQIEERNLLSVGYKNVIGACRASRRILSSIEDKERAKSNDAHAASIKSYRAKVEGLNDICEEILQILEHLIVEQTSDELRCSTTR